MTFSLQHQCHFDTIEVTLWCMAPTVPITFRISADLKILAERIAKARRLSLNSFFEVAVHNETAGVCTACGRPPRHVPRGLTIEFADFVRANRGSSLYVRLQRGETTLVYKGRLPRVDGRHLELAAESPAWTRSGQRILLDEIMDWEPAHSGTDISDWVDAHPGIAVDDWGLKAS